MSELVSNRSLNRALEIITTQSESLRLAGQALTKWLATCPREKARKAKAALVALRIQTYPERIALLIAGTIDTNSNTPRTLTRFRNWLQAHAPPSDLVTSAELARVIT